MSGYVLSPGWWVAPQWRGLAAIETRVRELEGQRQGAREGDDATAPPGTVAARSRGGRSRPLSGRRGRDRQHRAVWQLRARVACDAVDALRSHVEQGGRSAQTLDGVGREPAVCTEQSRAHRGLVQSERGGRLDAADAFHHA